MKSRKWIIAGIIVTITGLIFSAWAWNFTTSSKKKVKKQKFPFYQGMEMKTKPSKSVIDNIKSHYVFEPVLQGDLAQHEFTLKNDSAAPLELKQVRGCCGCLVENYTPTIEPGQTGVISVVLLTDQYGGKEIQGIIQATTNDPDRPEIIINITCEVKKFVDISEYMITLDGSLHQPIQGTSIVVPAEEYPFTITGIKPRKGIDILYSYKEIQQDGKKGYLITAQNKRTESGVIRDILYVQTDHPARPEFKIRVQGRITE